MSDLNIWLEINEQIGEDLGLLKTNQRKMTNYITEEITQKTVAFKI